MTVPLNRSAEQAPGADPVYEALRHEYELLVHRFHKSMGHPRDLSVCTWPICRHNKRVLDRGAAS